MSEMQLIRFGWLECVDEKFGIEFYNDLLLFLGVYQGLLLLDLN
jgi:hypothetical protein